MTGSIDALILLPRFRVENVNAISGPLTWGFPAPSAFTGFTHALQRKFGTDQVALESVAITCHRFDPQVDKASGYRLRFNQPRHPVNKDGTAASSIEGGRAHMEVSLLIGVRLLDDDFEPDDGRELAGKLYDAAMTMRLAGGSIIPRGASTHSGKKLEPEYLELSGSPEGRKKSFSKLRRRLLPGFSLVSRHGLLQEHLSELRKNDSGVTELDALMDLCCVHVDPVAGPEGAEPPGGKAEWKLSRAYPGWLVPLPVGYAAISELYEPGVVRNARDRETPFRFVESAYSMGEWISPHRVENPLFLMWRYQADPENGLYLCVNNFEKNERSEDNG